jgi:pyruvate formate lyase activating enzyme
MTTGIITNIQHFSIQDGPGIRTTVFFKGCPLRCRWCANPETQKFLPEYGWRQSTCLHCGACAELGCRFKDGSLQWDPSQKPNADDAEACCPTAALHVIGREMGTGEVLKEVLKDRPVYEASGGGITLSGGEPLAQPSFATSLLAAAGAADLHRAIETTLYAPWTKVREVVAQVDYLFTDIKTLDDTVHRRETGVSNHRILANLKRVRANFPELPICIRTPVVPGVNDNAEQLKAIAEWTEALGADYELLKYHRLGLSKYQVLKRPYPMGDAELSQARFEALKAQIQLPSQNQKRSENYV